MMNEKQNEELVVTLKRPVKDPNTRTEFRELRLQEPALFQAEDFHRNSATMGAMAAMRELIAAVAGVPPAPLKFMAVSDYKKCERFLTGFFLDA
ncbi:TPA: phage tail assembly protein [Escherichia coli]|nr:phage tail assembly protein [Escherichia coli]